MTKYKNTNISLNISFLELSEKFHRDSKMSSNSNGKRAIGVPPIEVQLYLMEWQSREIAIALTGVASFFSL